MHSVKRFNDLIRHIQTTTANTFESFAPLVNKENLAHKLCDAKSQISEGPIAKARNQAECLHLHNIGQCDNLFSATVSILVGVVLDSSNVESEPWHGERRNARRNVTS